MCRLASFFHNPKTGDIAVFDLVHHETTATELKLNQKIWREGHYLPNGKIECRVIDDDHITMDECNERLRSRFPTFKDFFNWAIIESKSNLEFNGDLDLLGCDLKGLTLPQSIGGSLDLSGCDLKGLTLPQSIGGSLDLRGCDLKGIVITDNLKNKVIK